jgi:iduronate 2-sulfatase
MIQLRKLLLVFGLFIMSTTLYSFQSNINKKKEKQNYNVLFIAIDDLRTELNCYGASHIKSPNIDKLAADGIMFKQAHVQQAICMASRASIMSGIRPEKKGIYTGKAVQDLMPDELTMNKFFKQNGYNIASCGKIYHHGSDTKNQFGDDEMTPKATWTGKGYVTPEAIEKRALNTEFNRGPAYEFAEVHDTIYEDGLNTLNAMRKMEALSKDDKPFFLAVGLKKPHLPFTVPKKYWDMYPAASIHLSDLKKRPENSYEKAIRTGGELGFYYNMPQQYDEIDDATALNLRRAYYACVSYVDAQVGNLMNQLDKLGIRENTIVVLWGDHGYKLGDYKSWAKWTNMNIDTNVPFIFNTPNGKKGLVSESPVEALDIYPTLAELCGLEIPLHVDGQSIVPLFEDPTLNMDRVVYTQWPITRQDYDRTIMGYSAKSSRFNYVEWVKLSTGKVVATELFDHEIDPMETKNVVGDLSYNKEIKFLSKKLSKRIKTTDHDHKFKKID